ncbi:MAG: TonB-dependent receptor, partial [Gammaproteobacteria bacterium]
NAGDAKVKGVEAEIFATPIVGLQFDLSGSYLDWEWKCVNPAVVGGASGPCTSNPAVINLLSSTPIGFIKEQAHAGIQYEFHLSNNGSSLTPRFDVTYQGAAPGSNLRAGAGTPSDIYGRVSGFTVANAHLTLRNAKKNLEATLEVTNVLNRYYFYSKFDLTGAGQGAITGSPAPPLAWALTVKKSF